LNFNLSTKQNRRSHFRDSHSTITPIFCDTYVTTQPLRAKHELLIKAENARIRNAHCGATLSQA